MEQITCKKCGSHDYRTEIIGQHLKAICSNCLSYMKFLPQNKEVLTMPFGKYSNKEIKSMTSKEEVEYLSWAVENMKLSTSTKSSIQVHLNSL